MNTVPTAPIAESMIELPGLGLSTRVLQAGEGPVVLMLHGNPDNADEWRLLMQRLAADHRCIAPDFPGYGRSPEPPRAFDYSLAQQLRFVDGVIAAMGVQGPVVLVVHDTGGMVGTAWAAGNLHRLRGVVFTNTVAFENFRWFAIARLWGGRRAAARWRAALGMRALALGRGALFRRIFSRQSPQLEAAQLDRFVQSFALNPAAKRTALRQFRQFVPPAFFRGFDGMMAQVTSSVPCRVLWGQGDPYLADDLAQRFGSATVTRMAGVGHWVPLVAPDELAVQVRIVAAVRASPT